MILLSLKRQNKISWETTVFRYVSIDTGTIFDSVQLIFTRQSAMCGVDF
jgi:hypothetical protein